jgi:UDP-N-acetylmuramate dehydrogenase
MKIYENYDLTQLNTFGVKATAKYLAEVTSEEEVRELWQTDEFKNNPKLFLGGGSNILFTQNWQGIVVLNKMKGIEIISETPENIILKSMGGEIWHDLVTFTISRGWWGLENLSSIPGSVGAAPMQNIGAYGAELKSVLHSVEAYDVDTGEKKVFENDMYTKGYRESIFKNEFRGKYFITAVILKLSKIPKPNTTYRSLFDYLEKNKIEVNGPGDIGSAVTEIRKEKLPDPKIINNAGSFFKNVLVSPEKFKELQANFPNMPHFTEVENIKIPSGWLIEECGFKGKRIGDAGVYNKHALVLVNYGNATGEDIKNLAEEIIAAVYKKFGLKLTPEVNFI